MSIFGEVLEKVPDDNISFGTYQIPKRVKVIADKAFRWCVSLKRVTIPERIISIGSDAFRGCTNLKEISLPFSVEKLGDEVFYSCKKLQKAAIFSNIDKIGNNMFNGCDKLKTVNLPNYIKEIGSCAFYNCISLKSVTTHIATNKGDKFLEKFLSSDRLDMCLDNVERIGAGAFYKCELLETLVFSEKIRSIEPHAFESCHNLFLNIETSLFYIDFLAFKKTFDVKSLILYNCKVNLDNYEDSIRAIRRKELEERINKYLRDNDIPSNQSPEDFNKYFIECVLSKLENFKDYDYRIDFNAYMNGYINGNTLSSNSKQNNNKISTLPNSQYNVQTFQSQINKPNSETNVNNNPNNCQTKGIESEKLSNDEINPIYKGIPFELYDHGKKNGMLDIIKEIKERIDIYLKNNNISDQKYFEYMEHKGFILEMLDCILNDKNYDYIIALNNYMKNYVETHTVYHVNLQKNELSPKVPAEQDNNSGIEEDSEKERLKKEIEQLKQELEQLKQNKPKVSLEKKK